MIIGIGSKNPTKINAVKEIFGANHEYITMDVSSGVSKQPFSDEETLKGAKTRSIEILSLDKKVDLGIGLEGGVTESEDGLLLTNWGSLSDRKGNTFIAGGARILLPEEVAEGVRKGNELAAVMDEFTSREDIRSKEGAIGVFTSGLVSRRALFVHVVQLLYGQYQFEKIKK